MRPPGRFAAIARAPPGCRRARPARRSAASSSRGARAGSRGAPDGAASPVGRERDTRRSRSPTTCGSRAAMPARRDRPLRIAAAAATGSGDAAIPACSTNSASSAVPGEGREQSARHGGHLVEPVEEDREHRRPPHPRRQIDEAPRQIARLAPDRSPRFPRAHRTRPPSPTRTCTPARRERRGIRARRSADAARQRAPSRVDTIATRAAPIGPRPGVASPHAIENGSPRSSGSVSMRRYSSRLRPRGSPTAPTHRRPDRREAFSPERACDPARPTARPPRTAHRRRRAPDRRSSRTPCRRSTRRRARVTPCTNDRSRASSSRGRHVPRQRHRAQAEEKNGDDSALPRDTASALATASSIVQRMAPRSMLLAPPVAEDEKAGVGPTSLHRFEQHRGEPDLKHRVAPRRPRRFHVAGDVVKPTERRLARHALEQIRPRQPRPVEQHALIDPRNTRAHQLERARERPVPIVPSRPRRPDNPAARRSRARSVWPCSNSSDHRLVGRRPLLAIERRIERDAMLALREVVEVMRENRRACSCRRRHGAGSVARRSGG